MTDHKVITKERAIVAAAYWLDCSPHERTEEDGIILAKYVRQLLDENERLERFIVNLQDVHEVEKARLRAEIERLEGRPKGSETTE